MKHHISGWLRIVYAGAVCMLGLALHPGQAAEQAVHPNQTVQPLAASKKQQLAGALRELRRKADTAGRVRVIVGVRSSFLPEGQINRTAVVQQRSAIQAAQNEVLAQLASLQVNQSHVKRFVTIPYMAMGVTRAELEQLSQLATVTAIEEDRLAAADLAQSGPLVGADLSWSGGFSGGGQSIAVLDTGVDKNHPFLVGKVVSEACFSTTDLTYASTSICSEGAASSVRPDSALPYASGVCPSGECDHGTHVAGIAAGLGSSYSGVARDATLIAVQVFSRFDSTDACGSANPCVLSYVSDQLLGLEHIYSLRSSHAIASVNMSLGGGKYSSQTSCDIDSPSTKAAIDNLRAAGIATVISSGNDGYTDSLGAPGCISSAVSVGSTWDSAGASNSCAGFTQLGTAEVDEVACYSNSASFLSLLAPGSAITASVPNSAYATWQGTSMAAPHVAGAFAVLKQKEPAATVAEVLAALASTGTVVTDPRNGIPKPRINVSAALAALTTGVYHTLTVSKTGTGGGVVSSSPPGIDCGPSCSASYSSGSVVSLSASADSGSIFTGWSGGGGACSGTGICQVSMQAAQSVSASFSTAQVVVPISLTVAGALDSVQRYSLSVPEGASALLVQISGGTGDADLYLRAGAEPDFSQFDCRPFLFGNEETCAVAQPIPGTYHLMLHGWESFSGLSLTASYRVVDTTHSLTVAKTGSGQGTITSTPGGIDCGATCSAGFVTGTPVTLSVTPAGSSVFTGWSGACSGTGACQLDMTGARYVGANFESRALVTPIDQTVSGAAGSLQHYAVVVPAGSTDLVVRTTGGTGDVDLYVRANAQASLSDYDCRPYRDGNEEICTFAAPSTGSYDVLLHGYSAYNGASLSVSYKGVSPQPVLTITNLAPGKGIVTSTPSGIACGTMCSASFAPGTLVTLEAVPLPNYRFRGWVGACTGLGPCTLTLNADQAATASFANTKIDLSFIINLLLE